jgi:DNA mismatch repair protein MLH1
MLEEYFSMKIDDQGRLVSLPTLLPGYGPPVEHLPFFMLCLGQRVSTPWIVYLCYVRD